MIKTKYFVVRQYQRSVKEELLLATAAKLPRINNKVLVVVSRKLVRKYCPRIKLELFIVVDCNVLITCFFGHFQEYLNRKKNWNI